MTETFTREELIERAEKAEAEVTALRARLKSTESALDRAMARSNSWREEAAKLQAQMLADHVQRVEAAAKIEEIRRPFGSDDRMSQPAETPRICATCEHEDTPDRLLPCANCLFHWPPPHWTPKPIPSTTDKGEVP